MAVKIEKNVECEVVREVVSEVNFEDIKLNIFKDKENDKLFIEIKDKEDEVIFDLLESFKILESKADKLYLLVGSIDKDNNKIFIEKIIDGEDYKAISKLMSLDAMLDDIDYSKLSYISEAQIKEIAKHLKGALSDGYTAILKANFGFNGSISIDPNLNNPEWVSIYLLVVMGYYDKEGRLPPLTPELVKDSNFKIFEPQYRSIVDNIQVKTAKEAEKDIKQIYKNTGGSGGGSSCGVGCYVAFGIGVVLVGAALWWGYNNFIGEGLSDEPIAIADDY